MKRKWCKKEPSSNNNNKAETGRSGTGSGSRNVEETGREEVEGRWAATYRAELICTLVSFECMRTTDKCLVMSASSHTPAHTHCTSPLRVCEFVVNEIERRIKNACHLFYFILVWPATIRFRWAFSTYSKQLALARGKQWDIALACIRKTALWWASIPTSHRLHSSSNCVMCHWGGWVE